MKSGTEDPICLNGCQEIEICQIHASHQMKLDLIFPQLKTQETLQTETLNCTISSQCQKLIFTKTEEQNFLPPPVYPVANLLANNYTLTSVYIILIINKLQHDCKNHWYICKTSLTSEGKIVDGCRQAFACQVF